MVSYTYNLLQQREKLRIAQDAACRIGFCSLHPQINASWIWHILYDSDESECDQLQSQQTRLDWALAVYSSEKLLETKASGVVVLRFRPIRRGDTVPEQMKRSCILSVLHQMRMAVFH